MKWKQNTTIGHADPEDMFADTRMTFGDHIEDLRTHLIRAIKGFILALIVSFFIGKPILHFIAAPVVAQMNAFQERYNEKRKQEIQAKSVKGDFKDVPPIFLICRLRPDQIRDPRVTAMENFLFELGFPPPPEPDPDKSKLPNGMVEVVLQIPDPVKHAADMKVYDLMVKPAALSTLSVTEAFVVYFKVCLMTGLVLGSPWIFYQIWAFVAAGLYPHEKKYVNYFLPVSLFLFLLGVFVCELLVMTKAVEALLWFNEWLGLQPDLRLNEWLGFAIFMPLVFGISFQTPLVMLFLQRIGILTVEHFRAKRKISIFLMAIFAAIITPSTDPVSMVLLWGPMCLLYELGIAMCIFLPGKPLLDLDFAESEEMVEV